MPFRLAKSIARKTPGVVRVSINRVQVISSIIFSSCRHQCRCTDSNRWVRPTVNVHRCPELNACISSDFWCDGVPHCPMGFDEDPANCADRNGVNLMYVGVLGGTAVVLFTVTVVAAVVCLRCKASRSRRAADSRRRASQKTSAAVDPSAMSADRMHFDKRFLEQNGGTVVGGGCGVVGDVLGKRYPSSSDDLYLECKDSMC